MITRAQMRRQLRAKGGIMNAVPRQKYGFGDFVRKLIPNELADIAVKAAPFVAPFNPGIAAAMRGIGRYDQRGSISDALKQGLGTYGFGKAAGYLGGAQSGDGIFGGQTFSKEGFRSGPVGRMFQKPEVGIDSGRGGTSASARSREIANLATESTPATTGKGVGFIRDATGLFKDVPILKDLPSLVQQQILVGGATAAGTYLYQKFLADEPPQDEGETMEEYLARRKENVGKKMRSYFDNYFKFDKEYSSLDDAGKDAFVARYNMMSGGRAGYQTGGITMANTLAENIRRNLANQDAFQQAINPSKQKIVERLQARQQEPSMMSQVFSGPAFDKYSAERTRAYTESPSRLQYNLDSNKAAGQFIQDKSKEIFGDNILGKGAGVLATAASVPLAAAITPFHEAAQVVAEDRIKPVSEYSGDVANFTRAFLAEKPLLTAAQRAGGVLQSIPVVGDAVTKAGEGIYDSVQSGKDSTGLEDYLEGTKAATPTPDTDDPLAAERARLIKEGIDPMSVGLIGGTGDTNRPTMADVAGPSPDAGTSSKFMLYSDPPGTPGRTVIGMVDPNDTKHYGGYDAQGRERFHNPSSNEYDQVAQPDKKPVATLPGITMPGGPEAEIGLAQPTYNKPLSRDKLMSGFQEYVSNNPEVMQGAGTAAIVPVTLPGGYDFAFSGSLEANAFRKYLESIGQAPYQKRAQPIESIGGGLSKLAGGGMPMGKPRVNQGGITELDYRAKGGFVPVGIKEKADDVPAMLSKNEFVFTADAVRGAGNGSVEKGAQKMYDTMKNLERRVT